MHIEIYKIKGKEYKYQVSNYRVGNKIKHKKKYLGPVVPVNKSQHKKSTGRKPSAFVRELNANEKQELEDITRSNNAFSKERAEIIIHSSQKIKVSEISKKMQREKRSVLLAINEFNKKGISCLTRGKTTGPKSKFKEEQKASIIQILNTDPRKLRQNFTTWSLSKLKNYSVKNKILEKISIESLRQIIKKGNKKYKKSRKWLYSNDPDFSKKN